MEDQRTYEELRKDAGGGEAEAQFLLGMKYFDGDGVDKEFYYAAKWFEKAANQNHAEAQNMLGICYADGLGVTKNEDTAKEWYEKAISSGCEEAIYSLALSYLYTENGERDVDKAIEIYEKGANLGYGFCQIELAQLYDDKEDMQSAVKWYEKAVEQGNGQGYAEYVLGHMYFNGNYFQKDISKAVELYEKGAANGCEFAMRELGDYYFYLFNNSTDYEKAAHYYKMQLELVRKNKPYGNKDSIYRILQCYEKSRILYKDKEERNRLWQMYNDDIKQEKQIKKQEKMLKKEKKKR